MKRASPFWFGALLVASTGLLYCGGDNTNSAPPGGSSGAGNTGGNGGGSSGSNTTTGPTSGPTTTGPATTGGGSNPTGGAGAPMTGGAAGTGNGGSGNGGTNAGGRGGGTGGTAVVVDAGACPRAMPNNGTACASGGEVCDYTGFACTCAPNGMTRDGGMRDGWMCVRVRPDAGGGMGGGTGADAAACPRLAPNNGGRCTAVGEVCPYTLESCTCEMAGGGMGDRWACTINGRDGGGRRGDGG